MWPPSLLHYRGKSVLTWMDGVNEYVIFDHAYREIARLSAGNGYYGDHHEFLISPQDTALILIYSPVPWDLSSIGGLKNDRVWEGIVQELDIETGKVLFEWHSIEHVGLLETYATVSQDGRPGLDYFHANSIEVDHDNNLLVSARQTFTVYKIDRNTGEIIWRLGGKNSDFKMGPGTRFSYQHDARRHRDGTISVFDNGTTIFHDTVPEAVEESRGIVLKLDEEQMSATLLREYTHPDKQYAHAGGNMQLLPNDNVFIGWGRALVFSEFSKDGELLFDARLPPPTLPTGISASRGAGTRPTRRGGRAHLRRGARSLRQLERSHGGFQLGGARRPAPGPNRAPRLSSPKRIRDGPFGAEPPPLRRRASQRPIRADTRYY
jgi:hypothetical protein